jgi:chromosome partitioning protein
MPIIAFANQKGGVGKTSMCLHVAGALAQAENRVLVVDMDQQGNLSSTFVDNIHDLQHTIADLLLDKNGVAINDVIKKTAIEHIDVLPSNLTLSDLDARLAGDDDAQYYLAEALLTVKDKYEWILIDCPPSLGRATRMALVAADGVVVPIECQDWAFKGSQQILSFVDRVNSRVNPNLRFLGFVINKFSPARRLEQDFYAALKEQYAGKVFQTEFHNVVVFAEAAAARRPITHYRPKSEQAETFRKFALELISYAQKKLH